MVSMKLLVMVLSVAVGSIIVMGSQIEAIPDTMIGVPPTDAMHTINVQTNPPSNRAQAFSDTLVQADFYDQKIYFVSDGSIIFNVTEAFNSTHAVP